MAKWQCIRLSDVLRSERIQQLLLRPLLAADIVPLQSAAHAGKQVVRVLVRLR